MDNRTCKSCNKILSIESFRLRKLPNGKEYRSLKCKECCYSSKRSRREEIRSWFSEFKKTLECNECGIQDHRVLEFHHRDASSKEGKVSDWATRGTKSKKNILIEISKCDVLCANCHRILHYEERNN